MGKGSSKFLFFFFQEKKASEKYEAHEVKSSGLLNGSRGPQKQSMARLKMIQ